MPHPLFLWGGNIRHHDNQEDGWGQGPGCALEGTWVRLRRDIGTVREDMDMLRRGPGSSLEGTWVWLRGDTDMAWSGHGHGSEGHGYGSQGTWVGSPSLGGGWRRGCSELLVPTPALPHTPVGKARCRHVERGCIGVKSKRHRDIGTCVQAVLLLSS